MHIGDSGVKVLSALGVSSREEALLSAIHQEVTDSVSLCA